MGQTEEGESNGRRVFKTITNDEIYSEIIYLKDITEKFVDAYKTHTRQDDKMFKYIWGVIGVMIITFVSFLFIFVKG